MHYILMIKINKQFCFYLLRGFLKGIIIIIIIIISLYFFQASERVTFLNPEIRLANHAHVTGPALYDTSHGPVFSPLPKLCS